MKTIRIVLLILATIMLATACGNQSGATTATQAAAPAPSPVENKDPLTVYASVLKNQYDLLVKAHNAGQIDQAGIDEFVAGWEKIAEVLPAARTAFEDLPKKARENYATTSFNYPWISGKSIFSDRLAPAGFLGSAISTETGEFLIFPESYKLLIPPNDGFGLLKLVATDIDPVLKKSQKKALAAPLAKAVLKCIPDPKLTLANVDIVLEDGSHVRPLPEEWYGSQ
jgi:hypothetical protein